MKDNYFTPEANLLEFDYANVVSASFDTPLEPNKNKQCSVPAVKNNNKCYPGDDPVVPEPNKKNWKCQ